MSEEEALMASVSVEEEESLSVSAVQPGPGGAAGLGGEKRTRMASAMSGVSDVMRA